MIVKVPKRKALGRAMSTRVLAHARIRNAVYVYHGCHLKNSGGSGTSPSPTKSSTSSPLAPNAEHIDPITLRRRPLTTSSSNYAAASPSVDESVYRATEEARVAKWLSRFSADDSGISGVDLAPKPGLQVHMRPPVFDRKVYEATEAVKGDKEAAKVVSEKKKDGLKLKKEDIKAPEKPQRKKSWEEVLKEPVYDTTYPLNAATATGHEANRSGGDVEPAVSKDAEPVFEAPVAVQPTGYPAQAKMVRDQEVLEATEDIQGSRKMKVYSGSGDKHKIKLDKSKAPKLDTVTGSRDKVVFAATEEAKDTKKLSKFTPPQPAKPAQPAKEEALEGDIVFRATEALARQHPLPKTSPRAGSDKVVFAATEDAATAKSVEKFTPGEQTQHLPPKPANFDMLPTPLRRPVARPFFGTTFAGPARDATVLKATEVLAGSRPKSSTSIPKKVLEDPTIAIDREVLEATERLSHKSPREEPAKQESHATAAAEEEAAASFDEPMTTINLPPQQPPSAKQATPKPDYTSWNPPAPPASSLSDPPQTPFHARHQRQEIPSKAKEEHFGGFESIYDRNSLSDPFLYPSQQNTKSTAAAPASIIPPHILQEARARLVKAYTSTPNVPKSVDELLSAATPSSSSASATIPEGEFAIKTPTGEMKILRLGEEVGGFRLVQATNEEMVEQLRGEAKREKGKRRARRALWAAVWAGGLGAGLVALAEEGRKVGRG